jgi:hypothetical protein
MASLWDAYVSAEVTHDFSGLTEAVVRRLDDAERMVHEKFGIGAQYYVMANEAPGCSAKLGDIIAAVMLHETEAAAAAERERIARLATEEADRGAKSGLDRIALRAFAQNLLEGTDG